MTKIKLWVVGIIAITAMGIFFTSCRKELTCYCETSTFRSSFSNDLNSVLDEVIRQRNGDCNDVASKLRDKGYADVSCTEQ